MESSVKNVVHSFIFFFFLFFKQTNHIPQTCILVPFYYLWTVFFWRDSVKLWVSCQNVPEPWACMWPTIEGRCGIKIWSAGHFLRPGFEAGKANEYYGCNITLIPDIAAFVFCNVELGRDFVCLEHVNLLFSHLRSCLKGGHLVPAVDGKAAAGRWGWMAALWQVENIMEGILYCARYCL